MNNQATVHRDGENGDIPSRCERYFSMENEWFFSTREGSSVGPFTSLESANIGLNDYLEFLKLAKPRVKRLLIRSMKTSKDHKVTRIA